MRVLALLALLLLPAVALAAPKLISGPMLAWCEPYEAAVWVQSSAEVVEVRYGDRTARAATGRDGIALVRLPGLTPATGYSYTVLLDGTPQTFPFPTTFRTRPAIKYQGDPSDVRFAFGSCAYLNDPGETYGGDYRIFGAIDRLQPHFMLWLGDNTYYRDEEWTAESSMRARFRQTRALPELAPLQARTPQFAIWDDHDYGPDDADRSYALRHTALEIFQDYFPAPAYAPGDVPGCYQRITWSDVDLFLLDDRYHRDPKGAGPSMLGPEQMDWLLAGLASSRATFKVVAMGSQALNPLMPYECWGQYPEERQRFLDFLAERRIAGVLLLTGDRHAAELLKLERPGAEPLYEFTSSPLTSGYHRNPREVDNPARVPGTWITDRRNFGVVEVTGPKEARRLTVSAHGPDGEPIWTRVLR